MEELLVKAARAGIRFEVVGDELKVTAPRGAMTPELQQEIKANKQDILQLLLRDKRHEEDVLPELVVDAAGLGELFPLTDLQHAYWLGRDSSLEMGNVATHLYVELECRDMQVDRLNAALCRMIDRHDMLRAVLDGNGSQKIVSVVPAYHIVINDQSRASAVEADAAILSMREMLSHQVLQVDCWPLFDIRVTLLPDKLSRLHVSLDLLILDAWSIFLFFKEWHQFYLDLDRQAAPFAISFRDYVLAEQALKKSKSYLRSYEYWMKKVEGLPAAPDLPLCADIGGRRKPRFSRREARIAGVRWGKLKEFARNHGLTPSCLLLAAYSEVLARWSSNSHFTINVTISNRMPLHADVQRLIGDFTTPMLQEIDRRDTGKSFLEFAIALQKQFASDMEHRQVSGVAVMREWAKRRGIGLQAAMPVVFSSGLIWSGDEEPGDLEQFGKNIFSVSQTSQVWLDHHVMELNGDLVFIFDAVDAVFEPGVLDAMFGAYCRLVESLHDSVDIWRKCDVVPLPESMLQQRVVANATQSAWNARALHADFVGHALHNPDRVAILSVDSEISYATLLRYASGIADWLLANSLRSAEPVAVVMHKGWEQVAAVMGVLLAGGAYMPVDANLPAKRQQDLLDIGAVRHILIQPQSLKGGVAQVGLKVLEVTESVCSDFNDHHKKSLDVPLGNLAYVIFTSGTTGVPKGVMIDHQAGMNTIEHINRLFGVNANDRVLGVSSLSFDLSVYDIFGLLSIGGALVIPDYRRGHDPVHWRELIIRHAVTIWNSAPQLMSMLLDSYTEIGSELFPIKTVLLSGDFIPLDIPPRVRQHQPAAAVISLGGATEASIWSIYYPIETVGSAWTSIPYGKPLPNQMIWVYDHVFRLCPDYVKGRIFIGGDGLAQGYWQDPEKTASRFVQHPVSGARLYDTGDLGRYADDGNVIILGRDDGQVKIRGHRIELGEIEAILRQHAAIHQCVVVANAASSERRYLIAYVALQSGAAGLVDPDGGLDSQSLRDFVAERLPEYMVPRVFVLLERLPVSANGKIDYRALPEVGDGHMEDRQGLVGARNAIEQLMLDVWSRLIPGNQPGVTDNFFELGGDSVLATHLVRELNAVLPDFRLEMHELFENLTIESLAMLYYKRDDGFAGGVVVDATPSNNQAAMLNDIDAGVRVVSALNFSAAQGVVLGMPKAVFLTGASGWVGRYVLAELLMMTSTCVYCLVRRGDVASAKQMLLECLRSTGVEYDSAWSARVVPVSGDLVEERLGLSDENWQILAGQVDRIYHIGASVNVLAEYVTHSRTNVKSIVSLLRLSTDVRLKSIFFISPMTVCRRRRAEGVEVLFRESECHDHDGFLTGYAQSKWAAEQLLLAARDAGLSMKIYRTSHALPAVRTGAMKPGDTYCSILRVAHQVNAVPDWENSAFHGVPVDRLAQLLVENSLLDDNYHGLVHLENHMPLSFPALLAVLRQGKDLARVSLFEWQRRCIEEADRLSDEYASLARVLFVNREEGAAVHAMFAAHAVDTGYMDRLGHTDRMKVLADAEYWLNFSRQQEWSQA